MTINKYLAFIFVLIFAVRVGAQPHPFPPPPIPAPPPPPNQFKTPDQIREDIVLPTEENHQVRHVGHKTVVHPQGEHPNGPVIIVIDVSGSMMDRPTQDGKPYGEKGDRISEAMDALFLILGPSSDGDRIFRVIAFNDGYKIWPGCTDQELPPGWSYYGPAQRDQAMDWVRQNSGNGSTNPVPAFDQAIQIKKELLPHFQQHPSVKGLSPVVIFITDGEFTCSNQDVINGVKTLRSNDMRTIVFGLNESTAKDHMKIIAQEGTGGLYATTTTRAETKEPQIDATEPR